jgi:hypothetical protein
MPIVAPLALASLLRMHLILFLTDIRLSQKPDTGYPVKPDAGYSLAEYLA